MIREAIEASNLNEEFQNEVQTAVLGLALLEELDPNETDEGINEGINDILGKFGLELEKKSPGVVEYLYKFSKGVGKFIWYAIKKDKKGINQMKKDFSKEELLDFLYKLDLVTMHLITGPLHFIDGMTGWDLGVAIEGMHKEAGKVVDKIKKALSTLKGTVTDYFAPTLQPIVLSKVTDIEKLL